MQTARARTDSPHLPRAAKLRANIVGTTAVLLLCAVAAAQTPAKPQQPAGTTPAVEFSDAPNFSVAGVTDWTAVGGHGSDATLRASETLNRRTVALEHPAAPGPLNPLVERTLRAATTEYPRSASAQRALGEFYLRAGHYAQAEPPLKAALALQPGAPAEFALAEACAGLGDLPAAQQHLDHALATGDDASYHRLAGELAEQAGQPLLAVQQLQRAVALDPSEPNEFALASELLLHRAIAQAEQVFAAAAARFPQSTRLQTGWGSALFAAARYAEAAQHLCAAAGLSPSTQEPYLLLGQAALAAPEPLPCAPATLERFLQLRPQDPQASYLFAMLLLKSPTPAARTRGAALLQQAVALDPQLADAWLQLGILQAADHHAPEAMALYRRAIGADPGLAEAHYRLGVALDRAGEHTEAEAELKRHEQLAAAQAAAVEQQRREVKQFVIALPAEP